MRCTYASANTRRQWSRRRCNFTADASMDSCPVQRRTAARARRSARHRCLTAALCLHSSVSSVPPSSSTPDGWTDGVSRRDPCEPGDQEINESIITRRRCRKHSRHCPAPCRRSGFQLRLRVCVSVCVFPGSEKEKRLELSTLKTVEM